MIPMRKAQSYGFYNWHAKSQRLNFNSKFFYIAIDSVIVHNCGIFILDYISLDRLIKSCRRTTPFCPDVYHARRIASQRTHFELTESETNYDYMLLRNLRGDLLDGC